MLKLYSTPRTRSTRPRWVLEELGVAYDVVTVDLAQKQNHKPEYLKIHPLGLVPALQDGENAIFESSAICMYLADKFPEKGLAPAPGTLERGLYYQWISFVLTTLEPLAFSYFLNTVKYPEEKRDPKQAQDCKEKIGPVLDVLARGVEGKTYIVGDAFSVADILLVSLLNWISFMKMVEMPAELVRYSAKHKERPSFKKSLA